MYGSKDKAWEEEEGRLTTQIFALAKSVGDTTHV
jgi:hypothetical protein